MAMEQYFEEAVARSPLSGQGKNSLEKWKNSDAVIGSDDNPTGGFDCNICLDPVQEPVVTLCGHLYCWPCIYKWLHFQTISNENQDQTHQQCPVCKAEVSISSMIPLYGRGLTTPTSRGSAPQFGVVIPKRPLGPTCGIGTIASPNATNNQPFLQQFHHHGYSYQPHIYYPQQGSYPSPSSPMLSPDGMTMNVLDPVTRVFCEMVHTRVFGDSITNLYTYPNSYNLAGITSPRIRRHIMQADKSLNRISIFLFCCVVLCLLLF